MDEGTTRNGYTSLPFPGPFFALFLSLDMRSRKELAEDWIEDRDGLLVFVRGISPLTSASL
jgi:hypothetical protein